jgi:capsular exopolysaccharide synthesis family protein
VPAFPRWGRRDEESFEHLMSESIDSIRTTLLSTADPLQVVMVTSAAAGEGKTTVASQLAGSLARAGRRTLLIDCDLRRPAAHQLFELPLQPGLSEVLMDEVHLAEATLSTDVDGLWVVPAGEWDRDVIQALARGGLKKAFDRLRQAYDFVVVDSHPVLAATDSLLVGQHADAVLMAVMRDVSEAPKVYAGLRKLASLKIRVLGAVVSGLPERVVTSGSYNCAVPAMR